MPDLTETAAVCARIRDRLAVGEQMGGFHAADHTLEMVARADLRHLLRCAEAFAAMERGDLNTIQRIVPRDGNEWLCTTRFPFGFAWAPTPLAAVLSALDATSTETDR